MKSGKGILAAALIAASLSTGAIAGTSQVSAEGTGHGKTVTEATNDALARAAAQVNGSEVQLDSFTIRQEASATYSDNRGYRANVDAESSTTSGASFQTQGQIASYKTLSTVKGKDGYTVRVKAMIYKYDVPGENDKRYRMAILPIAVPNGTYDLNGPVSSRELGTELYDALEAALNRGGRFTLLDRISLGTVGQELALVGSDFTAPAEKAKLKRIKGADYLVRATIGDIGVPAGERAINPATGQPSGKFRFEVNLRVVIPASGEVSFTDTIVLDKKYKTRSETMREMSNLLVGALSDRLYPSRVIGFNNGEAILNAGGATLNVGDRIAFYAEGAEMKDPYSGESLGRTENMIGEGSVSRVSGKLVYVAVQDGRPNVGMLAKREGGKYASPTDAQNSAAPEAGVRLPFD